MKPGSTIYCGFGEVSASEYQFPHLQKRIIEVGGLNELFHFKCLELCCTKEVSTYCQHYCWALDLSIRLFLYHKSNKRGLQILNCGLTLNSWFVRASLFFFFFLATLCGIWNYLDRGSNPCPLQWKCRVLTTGPPGKSRATLFMRVKINTMPLTPSFNQKKKI